MAVVNETFASNFFGLDNSIGPRFYFRPNSDPLEVEIIGVVKDALYENMRDHDERDQKPRFAYTSSQPSDQLNEITSTSALPVSPPRQWPI